MKLNKKTQKRFNKKAVSPLIATILLVAVALSLAGILYSWTSQNAKDTTASMSETTTKWIDCSSINLYIDYGCSYDSSDGISLILNDQSSVEIDDNITMTVIDADNKIKSATFEPDFQGRSMLIDNTVYSNTSDFVGLAEPLQKIKIFVSSCPDKPTYVTNCK